MNSFRTVHRKLKKTDIEERRHRTWLYRSYSSKEMAKFFFFYTQRHGTLSDDINKYLLCIMTCSILQLHYINFKEYISLFKSLIIKFSFI